MIKFFLLAISFMPSLYAQNFDQTLEKTACMLNQDIKSLIQEPKEVFVFLSFSVPEKSLRHYFQESIHSNLQIVFKGLPKEGLRAFIQRIQNHEHEQATISIRPDLFDAFQIDTVPSFVLKQGEHFDKITGEISVHSALKRLEEEGELSQIHGLKGEGS